MDLARVMVPTRARRRWCVVGKGPSGEARWFIKDFGISGNEDELLEKVRDRIQQDPDFGVAWNGWLFGVTDWSRGIECRPARLIETASCDAGRWNP